MIKLLWLSHAKFHCLSAARVMERLINSFCDRKINFWLFMIINYDNK